MEKQAVAGFGSPRLTLAAPFVDVGKEDIVGLGHALGVPYEETWSCYKGGEVHCGVCGTCHERREAFALAGVHDPTTYAQEPTLTLS
jgi:7-cyano-7-deazaguanine synthase